MDANYGGIPNPIMDKKEGFMQKTPIYEAKLLFGFALTIVCLVLSLTAYVQLQEISSDVYDITNNWETKPVSSVYIPSLAEESCPEGFSAITLEKSDFPGITKGSCGCTQNTEGFVSSAANCSDTAEATNYCMSMPTQNKVSATKWRNSNICFKRDGEAASSWDNGYVRRPYPSSVGQCPEGYRKCGAGVDYEEGAVCFPIDTQCPITGLLVTPVDDPPPSSGQWTAVGVLQNGTYTVYTRREFPGELPLVNLQLHLTDYPDNDYLDGVSYDADRNKRGPCYTGSTQTFSNNRVKSDQVNLWMFSVSYPSACRKEDKRYTLFDRRDTQAHFLETMARESAASCAGLDVYALNDPRYNVSTDPDFVNSGVPCGSNGYVCTRDSQQLTNCAANDNICKVVVNQNVCGLYVRASRSVAGAPQTFGMYRRSEITWREDCAVTRDAVYRNVDPLRAAVNAQLAGVVLSFIFGITFGLLVPIAGVALNKDGGGKYRIRADIDAFLIRVDPYIHIVKLGPLIAAIIFISRIYRMYAEAGEDDCSDPTTNATFDYLGKTLPGIFQNSLANVLIECGLILAGFYTLSQFGKEDSSAPGQQEEQQSCCSYICCCGCLCGGGSSNSNTKVVPAMEMVPTSDVPPMHAPTGQPPAFGVPPQDNAVGAPPA